MLSRKEESELKIKTMTSLKYNVAHLESSWNESAISGTKVVQLFSEVWTYASMNVSYCSQIFTCLLCKWGLLTPFSAFSQPTFFPSCTPCGIYETHLLPLAMFLFSFIAWVHLINPKWLLCNIGKVTPRHVPSTCVFYIECVYMHPLNVIVLHVIMKLWKYCD